MQIEFDFLDILKLAVHEFNEERIAKTTSWWVSLRLDEAAN